MAPDDVSAENLLNIILDEVDDLIIINDAERNIIWMNRAAQSGLGVSIESAVGMKCFELFGATCCCDECIANHTLGGPRHRCGRKFICKDKSGGFECKPVPYYREGKLKVVVQRIRPLDKNE